MTHQLLAIVAVEKEHRVQCQQPGCGRGVFARIHVVDEDGKLMVLGSDCYSKRFEVLDTQDFKGYGGGSGKRLTDEERQMLVNNTAALIAKLAVEHEHEHEREAAAARAKLAALHAVFQLRKPEPVLPLRPVQKEFFQSDPEPDYEEAPTPLRIPPAWAKLQKKNTGLFAYGLAPSEGFVFIQSATHEGCFIAPLPGPFEGWDEALPPNIGTVDSELNVYISSLPINSLSRWFMARCKKGSRIDGDPLPIQDFGFKL